MLLPIRRSTFSPYLLARWLSVTRIVGRWLYPAFLGTNSPLTLTWWLTPSHFFTQLSSGERSHDLLTSRCSPLVLRDLYSSLLRRNFFFTALIYSAVSNYFVQSSYLVAFLFVSSINFTVCTHFATLSYHACIQPIVINIHIKMKPSTEIHGLSVVVTANLVGIIFKYMVQKYHFSTSLIQVQVIFSFIFDFCAILNILLQLHNLNNFNFLSHAS